MSSVQNDTEKDVPDGNKAFSIQQVVAKRKRERRVRKRGRETMGMQYRDFKMNKQKSICLRKTHLACTVHQDKKVEQKEVSNRNIGHDTRVHIIERTRGTRRHQF